MGKRRAEDDAAPAKHHRSFVDTTDDSSRTSALKAHILGLNAQFASWITSQNSSKAGELWIDGARDYIKYAEGLLNEYKDVASGASQASESAPSRPSVSFALPTSSEPTAAPSSGTGFGSASASGFGFGGAKAASSAGDFAFGAPVTSTSDKPSLNGDAKQPTFGAQPGASNMVFGTLTSAATNDTSAAPLFGSAASGAAAASAPAKPFSFLAAPASEADKGSEGTTTSSKPLFAFGAAAGAESSEPAAATKAAPAFAFGATAGDANKSGSSDTAAAASKPTFAFGGGASSDAAASSSLFSFGSKPAGTTAAADSAGAAPFSFGAGATAAASASAPAGGSMFNFGGSSSAAGGSSSSAPLFSFPAASATAAGSAPANEEEGEEEGPAKFESAVAVNEEAGTVVFKAKSKFMHMVKSGDKSNWESKGVGTFMLRVRNDDSKKPFVTFTTEAGRVLYIANISKNMNVILVDAKNGITFSAPWSPDGVAPPTSQGVMFFFSKGQHNVFKAELGKLQADMPE